MYLIYFLAKRKEKIIIQKKTLPTLEKELNEQTRQVEKLSKKINQPENLKSRTLAQTKNEKRKIRTHRLIERGAIFESLTPNVECITNKSELDKEITQLESRPPEPKAFDNLITKLSRFHENGGEFTEVYSPYVRHLKGIKGLKNIQKAVGFLQATKIESIEQLQAKLTANRQKRDDIMTATASMKTRIDEFNNLLENYGIYKEHKPIIVEC